HLSESSWTIQRVVQAENHKHDANQVSLSNSIGRLRYLCALDWRQFVESMSVVEGILRGDPEGVYGRMEFATRDRYRHIVEKIAKHSPHSEPVVARQAIAATQEEAAARGTSDRAAHVGYHLIAEGRAQLERAVEARLPVEDRLAWFCRRSPALLYVGGIFTITLILTGLLVEKAYY